MECGNTLEICGLRATLLDDTGAVADVDDNMYVSDKIVEIGWSPTVRTGAETELPGGCNGCLLGTHKYPDKVTRFGFALSRGAIEPALQVLMLGANPVTSGSDIIGIGWPDPSLCIDNQAVAFEFWTKHWVDDAPDLDWPWWHHVYPWTTWAPGDQTYGADLTGNILNGTSRSNPAWGQGPYGDGPGIDFRRGGYYLEDANGGPPAGFCGLQTATPGS